MLVIMGLSGSGKSTLVRCFSRLHEITAGTIEVDGVDIGKLSEKNLLNYAEIKWVWFSILWSAASSNCLENVAFPLEMRGQDKITRREQALK